MSEIYTYSPITKTLITPLEHQAPLVASVETAQNPNHIEYPTTPGLEQGVAVGVLVVAAAITQWAKMRNRR